MIPTPIVLERGEGGAYRERGETLALVERAYRDSWGISPEVRRKAVAYCEAILDDPNASRDHGLRAVRVLGYLDEIDRRRERDAAREESAEGAARAAVVSAVLATPEGRAALQARTLAAADAVAIRDALARSQTPAEPPPSPPNST